MFITPTHLVQSQYRNSTIYIIVKLGLVLLQDNFYLYLWYKVKRSGCCWNRASKTRLTNRPRITRETKTTQERKKQKERKISRKQNELSCRGSTCATWPYIGESVAWGIRPVEQGLYLSKEPGPYAAGCCWRNIIYLKCLDN